MHFKLVALLVVLRLCSHLAKAESKEENGAVIADVNDEIEKLNALIQVADDKMNQVGTNADSEKTAGDECDKEQMTKYAKNKLQMISGV